MARINDTIEMKVEVDKTEVEETMVLLKELIKVVKELRSLGIRKKTLNLLIKDICLSDDNKDER